MDQSLNFLPREGSTRIRAILLGDRIDTATFERSGALSATPFAFRAGASGVVVAFRYGAVTLIGLTPDEEEECLRALAPRVRGAFAKREEELAAFKVSAEQDDHVPTGGPISIKTVSLERLLVIAEAITKSVVLAHDEREVAAVFDIEPFARELAKSGRARGGRTAILKRIGNALLVQQRVSGYVAIAEKPDVLWDRPDLERLYARLEDEYELKERVDLINRKLAVISETAKVLTDLIDTQRSLRLEFIIVILIVVEALIASYQIYLGQTGH